MLSADRSHQWLFGNHDSAIHLTSQTAGYPCMVCEKHLMGFNGDIDQTLVETQKTNQSVPIQVHRVVYVDHQMSNTRYQVTKKKWRVQQAR